ncbi:tRNA lysidine(34) synthetase TilS [Thalassococcus sp. CAU 1522]|uniref:tRNA(Ile)-lysidine synthase n=2 Tax=Thalassococcus arenae TaxID=2851652 RepID=A0ABS6N5D1_9RHOB|nr:tRNA lysidine(34) synthetase TilS [Thalassococcus arenae]MBV2358824.1 tRNA lysidine(34) synthetase TilS [Thalassococcus arenae]
MGQLLGPNFPTEIALAVSGGGDSMAMLYLAHNWTRAWGVKLWVVTVDHGLRPESATEAAMVAGECATLGWPHATLRWHWDGAGNVMDAARRARLSLIDRWRGGIDHVLMAHTRDDVAETFLMRLARGSGLDGLSAMRASRQVRAVPDALPPECSGACPPGSAGERFWIKRPCLDMDRAELRHYLRTLRGRWVEDPSNEDPAYDRARMRRLLALLGAEGIGAATLAATAKRLREDRFALIARAVDVWRAYGSAGHGTLSLDPDWHGPVEPGTQRRLLAAMLRYVSGAEYAPRAEALEDLRQRVVSGGGGTLHGCEVQHVGGRPTVFREFAAVAQTRAVAGQHMHWDGRWRITDAAPSGLIVRALGEDGWQQLPDRPDDAPPHRIALSLPSLWDGARLVACDAMGLGPGNTTVLPSDAPEPVRFARFLLMQ